MWMPRGSGSDVVVRRWVLLKLLTVGGRGKTVGRLASEMKREGFDVGAGAVGNDLKVLAGLFPLICHTDEEGRMRWQWEPGQKSRMPRLPIVGGLSTWMLDEMLHPFRMDAVREAGLWYFGKLGGRHDRRRFGNPFRWDIPFAYVDPSEPIRIYSVPDGVVDTVRDAVRECVYVEIDYRLGPSNGDKLIEGMLVCPLGIVRRSGELYMVATSLRYMGVRFFNISRIEKISARQQNLWVDSGSGRAPRA